MKRASEELRALRRELANGNYVNSHYLDTIITKVEHMEEAIDEWPKVRTGMPDTSYFDGTLGSLKRNQADVYACFDTFGIMDGSTLEILYERHAFSREWKKQAPSGIRARRKELERLGLVVRVDDGGLSPTGRKAGRYAIAQ